MFGRIKMLLVMLFVVPFILYGAPMIGEDYEQFTFSNQGDRGLALISAYAGYKPDYAHEMIRYLRGARDHYGISYDGMNIEGLNYHHLWLDNVTKVSRALYGHTDPANYVDAIDGTSFQAPLTHNEIWPANIRQQSLILGPQATLLPDGRDSLWHDTGGSNSQVGESLWWFGFSRGEPLEYSQNQILPGMCHVVLGDGRGQGGEQVQSQLHSCAYLSGHAHKDTLMFSFFARNRPLFSFPGHQKYTKESHNKNLVLVNHEGQNPQSDGASSRGSVEIYAPTLPGLSVARMSANKIHFGGYPGNGFPVSRYRRTLVQNTVDLGHPYVVDVFEVHGGAIHEYMLGGAVIENYQPSVSVSYEQTASSNIPLSTSGAAALYGTSGMWARFNSEKIGTLREGYVDFRFKDASTLGTRSWLPAQGSGTLGLSKLYEPWAPKDRVHMMIRREDTSGNSNLVSRFVVVHEVIDGSPEIQRVDLQDLSTDAIGLKVTLKNRTDTYLMSFEGQTNMTYNGVSADAEIAVSVNNGSKSDLWLIGGTNVDNGSRSLSAATGEYVGDVLAIERTMEGAPYDMIQTDMPLPAGRALAGQLLMFECMDTNNLPAFVDSFVIDEVVVNGSGLREVRVRQDPAIRIDPQTGGVSEIYYPKHTAASGHLRLVASHSTVPYIAHVSPGRDLWKSVLAERGTAFATFADVEVTTVPPNAQVRYTLDGSMPSAGSPVFSNSLRLQTNVTLSLQPINSAGVTPGDVQVDKYYRMKEAVKGVGGLPGLAVYYYSWGASGGYERKDEFSISALTHAEVTQLMTDATKNRGTLITGYLKAPATGFYTFYSRCDTSIDLSIGGELLIRQHQLRDTAQWKATVFLEAGYHALEIDYYNKDRLQGFAVDMEGPGIPYGEISPSLLFKNVVPFNKISCELWYDVGKGKTVSELTSFVDYPHAPHAVEMIPELHYEGYGTKYGARTRALLVPKITGDYYFYIASSNESELWLSADSNEANKTMIARVNDSSPDFPDSGWLRYANVQTSVVHHLVADQSYYLEVLHKKSENPTGGDYLTVIWSGPGINDKEVIAGHYLKAYPQPNDGYESWRQTKNWNGADDGRAGDPDADGKSNFLEYALDLNPLQAETDRGFSIQKTSSGGYQLAISTIRPELFYQIEVSSNLLDPDGWIPGPAVSSVLSGPYPIETNQKIGFMRLRISNGR